MNGFSDVNFHFSKPKWATKKAIEASSDLTYFLYNNLLNNIHIVNIYVEKPAGVQIYR
jgi:hypothetical protein